jgi:hypothetical protein
MRRKKEEGRIVIPGVLVPEAHELMTAQILASQGWKVQFIVPDRLNGRRTPDVLINGVQWEMKCPTGASKSTVQAQLKRALRQSPNIIFDSIRTKLSDDYIQAELRRNLRLSRSIKRLIFISKRREFIEIT